MAMIPLFGGREPYGSIDIVNTEAASILGGEVMTLTSASRVNSLTETAAPDVLDGYLFGTSNTRPAATRASTATQFPLFLADDGQGTGATVGALGYLTYFGRVVGANTGLGISNGTLLGPNTMTGSGKVTLWQHPGMYEVSVDACASDFITALTSAGLAVGSIIGFGSGADLGKLSHTLCANKVANSGVARFVEFSRSESYVTTPAFIFNANTAFDRIKIVWDAGLGTRTL